MATVGRWLSDGWRWWTGELSAMLPARLARGRQAMLVEMSGTGWRTLGGHAAPQGRVAVALPPDQVLVRVIDAPPLNAADSRAMIAMDLDRLTPFTADKALFDIEKIPPVADGGPDRLRLCVIQTDRARRWVQLASEAGLEPVALGVLGGDNRLHFDFMPQLRGASSGSRSAPWWIAVAVLFAANIAMLVWRDIQSVDALRSAVEEQGTVARTATLLSGRIAREDARRTSIIRQQKRLDALRVMNAVASVLPPGAWVQRLGWDGTELRLSGLAPDGVSVQDALLTSPLVSDVVANDSDAVAPASGSTVPQSFDLSVTIRHGGTVR